MNRIAYSSYHTEGWNAFKRLFSNRTERDYCEFASRIWLTACAKASPSIAGMTWDRDSVYVDNHILFLWRFRKVNHYFLAPGVADFCARSVREFSGEYCKRLPPCDAVPTPCSSPESAFLAPLSYFHAGSKDKVQGGFAVHFPAKERSRSVMVIPDALIPVPLAGNLTSWGGMMQYYFVANDGEDTLLMQKSAPREYGSDEGTLWLSRLVFGLSLYMDAFPDAVVEAGTDAIHQINHYDGHRHIVKRNEIVDEEQQHSVSPHWRCGHFRLLTSEKFVRKHGQTVYVRGTFVKGKAFDVLDDVKK